MLALILKSVLSTLTLTLLCDCFSLPPVPRSRSPSSVIESCSLPDLTFHSHSLCYSLKASLRGPFITLSHVNAAQNISRAPLLKSQSVLAYDVFVVLTLAMILLFRFLDIFLTDIKYMNLSFFFSFSSESPKTWLFISWITQISPCYCDLHDCLSENSSAYLIIFIPYSHSPYCHFLQHILLLMVCLLDGILLLVLHCYCLLSVLLRLLLSIKIDYWCKCIVSWPGMTQ